MATVKAPKAGASCSLISSGAAFPKRPISRSVSALGFWAALREVFDTTAEQRFWFHKTGNVLNAMPKSVQTKAKGHSHEIWQAETKVEANTAFDFFVET